MDGSGQEARYREAADLFGPAIGRLARGWEADADLRRDLVQDIHVALWRSLAGFDGRCSLRTWVYRVAHNVAASHVAAGARRGWSKASGLDEAAALAGEDDPERNAGEGQALARLTEMIRALGPPDRQIMLLYLEDLDAAAIGEVVGLKAGAVATRISRLKAAFARRFETEGGRHGE